MIAHIQGTLAEKFAGAVIVDVSGVGYEILVTSLDFESIAVGDKVKFYTFHRVSETSEDLFGFLSLAAKKLFEMLLSVNGIGPKAALAILSLGTPEDVRNAIANSDSSYISKAAGVGKKSAERVIVDLNDKVGLPSRYGSVQPLFPNDSPGNKPDEALDALIALGFPLKEATAALEPVDPSLPVDERIRLALKTR
ncbi:Holliday junction branch migration protein RuvA [Candidatus Saccharibacteria bacterium]|nr:Holliday junction branch migration protein RuvA [Candidatus Saccharibacteria bacterium]